MKKILSIGLVFLIASLIFQAFPTTARVRAVVAANIRILVDETHDEWGTSGSPPPGFVSPRGSWANFLQELQRSGYNVQELTEGRISSELLQDYDILIIGTAWSEFSADEIQSIKNFVVEGGGLFLTGLGWSWVGYHPSSTIDEYPMNQIAEKFGIEFNNDIIYDPTDNNGNPGSPVFYDLPTTSLTSGVSQISARQNFPCSLNTTVTVIDSIRGDSDSYTEIYKQGDHPPLLFALQYGAGRVVCLGHEGFFYDLNLYEYDNLRFGLNIIYWLEETPSARITSYEVALGTFFPGDTVTASATIQNDGNVAWTFYVSYSVQDLYGGLWDTPHTALTLDAGASRTITLHWTIPTGPAIQAPPGSYIARIAVWKGESEGELQGRLDLKEKQNAFDVYVPMVQIGYRLYVNVWPSWTVKDYVIVSLYDADDNLVNEQHQDAGIGHGPYHFEFLVFGSPPDGTYKVGAFVMYDNPAMLLYEFPGTTSVTFWLEGEVTINLYPSVPSMNTVVTLDESHHKLLLHVYDSQGHHVGMNHTTNRLEINIPDAYYTDHLNGTILIMLPSTVTDFTYVVDSRYAVNQTEDYVVTLKTVQEGETISETVQGGTITQAKIQEHDVQISQDGKTIHLDQPWWGSWLERILWLTIGIAVGAIMILVIKRRSFS